jgi:hypothetical protein
MMARIPSRTSPLLFLPCVVSLALSGCDHRPNHPPPESRLFTERWVWDSTGLWRTPTGDPTGDTLVPGARLTIGRAVDQAREIMRAGMVVGYVPESLLHHAPLPTAEAVYQQATLEVLRELLLPHQARFPPADSATVLHFGRGAFEVRGTLSGEGWSGGRRMVLWAVWLRRLRYRWAVDSVRVDSATVVR